MNAELRRSAVEFLIVSSLQLGVTPVVKYTALSIFVERFLPSIKNNNRSLRKKHGDNWLLQPLRQCNLQLFALVSVWVSSKIHDTRPLSVQSLKSLGDVAIKEQHYTTRDFLEAEVVLLQHLQVLDFEIGASNVAYVFLEDFLIRLRKLARVGDLVKLKACMDIMDVLYETEETSVLYNSPDFLAAAILVASYVISVPKQEHEFPLLSWVKFVSSFKEEDTLELARTILQHVLKQTTQETCQLWEGKG
ncbi:cyclin-J18-like isoform X3 [Papaver somniferum]|uniref:cyclin-J18-like isoform X3 n=1 Tax=Papaver somniferum TaxID=3469 RepID=UPI000E6FB380|nr:cyclin-J18-like isoform X3 [Papaver somniferum]